MKVALIHDHLAQDGGAEKVLAVLSLMFPTAVIYTLLADQKIIDKYYSGRRVDTSIIQKLPGGVRHYKWYLPLMPMAVEFFDLREYDLVISDTASFAKGIITNPDTLHICYCHTPTRYLWSDTHQYIGELRYNKIIKKVVSLILNRLRVWDKVAADRVDFFIANSKTVQKRITKYYRRDSALIYPPVETTKFKIADKNPIENPEAYFLAGCRLAPYKRIDIVIEAFKALGSNFKLKIFGDGIDLEHLKELAENNPEIEFLGRVSEETKVELFKNCLAFINPQEEDFGITMVEALASGRPVLAYAKGGATEIVQEGINGLLFKEQSAGAIKMVVENFYNKTKSKELVWDSEAIKTKAEKFSILNFQAGIKEFITAHNLKIDEEVKEQ